jgi:hypothetical protein
VPGNSTGSKSRAGGAGTGRLVLALTGCLLPVLAVLVGLGSLVVHYAIKSPTSPYQVAFSTSGKACNEHHSNLILDQDSGEVLYCALLPPFDVGDNPGPRAQGPFSAGEVGRITDLSKIRASDGHLDKADRDAVRRLVAQIGREHGYDKTSPTLMERLTWRVGLTSLIGGLAVLAGLGVWGGYVRSQTGGAAR